MLKKLKNSQILDLVEGISIVNRMVENPDTKFESTKKFSYAIIMNDANHRSRAEAIIKVSQPSETYIEYEKKREELVNEYSIKDSDGKPVLIDQRWVRIDKDRREELDEKIKLLDQEYSDVLDKRNKDLEDFNSILEEEHDVDIITVSLDDIPDTVANDISLMKRFIHMID